MPTPVWITACTQQPIVSATTINAQCPRSSRVAIETTVEHLEGLAPDPTDPIPLDTATLFAVFSASFATAVLFFLVARGVGSVLRFIRFGG